MKMINRWGLILALVAGMLASAVPADAQAATPRENSSCKMSHRGAFGKIAVRAGRKRFPANAEVSLSRTRAGDKARRIKSGLKKRREDPALPNLDQILKIYRPSGIVS